MYRADVEPRAARGGRLRPNARDKRRLEQLSDSAFSRGAADRSGADRPPRPAASRRRRGSDDAGGGGARERDLRRNGRTAAEGAIHRRAREGRAPGVVDPVAARAPRKKFTAVRGGSRGITSQFWTTKLECRADSNWDRPRRCA